MRLALAQIDCVVGDLDGNRAKILSRIDEARLSRADLIVFPELATTGYPPEDLLLRPGFVRAARESLDQIAAANGRHHRARRDAAGSTATSPTPARCARMEASERSTASTSSRTTASSTSTATSREGRDLVLLRMGEASIGVTICEDVWQPGPPATDLALAGAQLIVNLSASPFHVGKAEDREEMLVTRARDSSSFFAFCNLVGGQDELVFDGHSVVIDDSGEIVARAAGFAEELLVVDIEPTDAIARRLRDARRRELDRSRDEAPPVEVVELEPRVDQSDELAGTIVAFEPALEQMRLASSSVSATTSRRTGSPTS